MKKIECYGNDQSGEIETKCTILECPKEAVYQVGSYIPFHCFPSFYCEDHLPESTRKRMEKQEANP